MHATPMCLSLQRISEEMAARKRRDLRQLPDYGDTGSTILAAINEILM